MGTGDDQELPSGSIFVGFGAPTTVARIPIPGSNGLFIELSPRGYIPKGGSTSTLFFQDISGKRHLRLDYGYNKVTGVTDYHWNQEGTLKFFGITDHTPVGKVGEALYKSAKFLSKYRRIFKYGGHTLLIIGAVEDTYSIVVAKKKVRQVAKVTAGWVGASYGARLLGAGGAAAGSFIEPGGGTAIGGGLGALAGGALGYFGSSWVAGKTYDIIEDIYYEYLLEVEGGPVDIVAPTGESRE